MSANMAVNTPLVNVNTGRFLGTHIISASQFEKDDLDYIFEVARLMRSMVKGWGTSNPLAGRILANLFYEPSTRTSSSFTAAMERLGGSVIPINEVRYSSVAKGENLSDTIRTLECYADVIVLRHYEKGSAAIAAEVSRAPIINAGDGIGEHPTQALLDLFTIVEELGNSDNITVTMLGDLRFGRTVHSLSRLLSLYNVRLNYVSPNILQMPPNIVSELREKGIAQSEYTDLEEVLPETDVLYVTRIQKERFSNPAEYESVKGAYVITPKIMERAKKQMILMHPFPRVGEISPEIDHDPRAAYFRQMKNGLYIRMALLAMVLGKV